MKIGVTGNFWSGHRDIIKYFEDKLVPVFDADLLFKFLINYDLPTMKLIKKRFGAPSRPLRSLDDMIAFLGGSETYNDLADFTSYS